MTILPELERDLIDAAARQAGTSPPDAPRERRRSSRGGMLAIALSSGVALAVAAVILLAGRGTLADHRPSSTAQVPGRRQLVEILGVLRRPQDHADLHSFFIARLLGRHRSGENMGGPGAIADIPLIRRAATTPWGTGIFLIPVKVTRTLTRIAGRSRAPATIASRGQEGLMLFVDSGGTCCASALGIETRGQTITEGAGRSFAGGSTRTRLVTVVPDGVAKVAFLIARQPNPHGPPGTDPIYRRVLRVVAPVHHNTVAVEIDRQCCAGIPVQVWYAADGRVIHTVGSPSRLKRVIPPVRQAPPTPQSRAALRNPATPNRVTVTPAAGSPGTHFTVHFRVLISDADYSFHVTGPRCGYRFQGGQGGGPSDVRGRIYSAPLGAIEGQKLCPGTYTVSVSIMDFGAAGNLRHPAGPFGSAMFTVRR